MRFSLCLILLFAAFLVQAQDEEAWTIEEACLPEASTPPENWSYDGTILVSSAIGIHGINQDWDTRRVLAYVPNETRLAYFSPDDRTWITFQGDSNCWGSCFTTNLSINWMTIHNLSSLTPESRRVQWRLSTQYDYQDPEGDWDVPSLRWLSPNRFLYVKVLSDNPYYNFADQKPVVYDLTTGEIELYETAVYHADWHNISPDGTIVIDSTFGPANVSRYFLSNPQDRSPMVELHADYWPFSYYTLNVWSPDSQYFLATKLENPSAGLGERVYTLWLMNRDGEGVSQITEQLDLGRGYINVEWSPDGRYLALFRSSNTGSRFSWLIDLQEKRSYDLCVEKATSLAWSPNSQELALQAYEWEDDSDTLTIFEPATWSLYTVVSNADAWIVGWQAEEN